MTTSQEYDPPTSADIKARQNETEALRLLVAQRRLYSKAKRWLGVRWIGMILIGIGAPVVAVLWPSVAVAAAAVAGVWLFLGRTVLLFRQRGIAEQAAAVQEQFDAYVFGMPELARRSTLPKLEDIAALAGPDAELPKVAQQEKLLDWYPVDESGDGTTAVAIAQRANASYSDSLLKTTATTWSVLVGLWIAVLVVASLVAGISLADFLLGVAFPVLPSFLDVVEYVTSVRRSAIAKADLANLIESRLSDPHESIKPEELLMWQTQIFDLRRSAPEVPDIVYKLRRKRNEQAMESAARQLSERTKTKGHKP